jgi:hypothetical protein
MAQSPWRRVAAAVRAGDHGCANGLEPAAASSPFSMKGRSNMNRMRHVNVVNAILLAVPLVAGMSATGATARGATEQAAAPATQTSPGVVITANPSNVPVEFTVMPVEQIGIYRNDKAYKMQDDEFVREDYSGLKDYIALVCTRKSETGGGLSIGMPSISGVKRVDAKLKPLLKGGRYYHVAMASTGFESLYAVNDLKGKTTGYLGLGHGTLVLVWLMPNVPGNYEVAGLYLKGGVIGIRIQ